MIVDINKDHVPFVVVGFVAKRTIVTTVGVATERLEVTITMHVFMPKVKNTSFQ